jgi:AcrR family transcriptional regulator
MKDKQAGVKLRKKPTQARSIEKYHHILDVVADLVEQGGTDGLTTNLIAETANVPVGTLYQFFPNKESILYALFERQLEQLDAMFEPYFSEQYDHLSIEQLMSASVKIMSQTYGKVPGMVNIMNHMHVHAEFRALGAKNNARLAKWFSVVLHRRYPEKDESVAQQVADAVIELGDAVFRKLLLSEPSKQLTDDMLLGLQLMIIGLVETKLAGK